MHNLIHYQATIRNENSSAKIKKIKEKKNFSSKKMLTFSEVIKAEFIHNNEFLTTFPLER
jgi:hypothetical protein